MSVVANLDINLRGNTQGIEAATTRTSQKVSQLKDQVEQHGSRIGKVFGWLGTQAGEISSRLPAGSHITAILSPILALGGAALTGAAGLSTLAASAGAVVAAIAAIGPAWVAAGLSAMGGIAQLNKASDKLGISIESLTGFVHGSKLDLDEFSTLFIRLEKNIADAANGSKEANATFQQLGISAREMIAASPEQHIEALARAFQTIPTQAEKIRMSMELFGRGGVDMLRLLSGGTEGLKKAQAEAESLGLVVTKNQAMQVSAAKGAMTRMQQAVTGVMRTAAITIAPFVEMIADAITDMIKWFNSFRDELIDFSLNAAFAFKNFSSYAELYFTQGVHWVVMFGNTVVHIFTEVIPKAIERFIDNLKQGDYALLQSLNTAINPHTAVIHYLQTGKSPIDTFKDALHEINKEALNIAADIRNRPEGAIEEQLRIDIENRQKLLERQRQQFLADKKKAILPRDMREPITAEKTGKTENAAVERGSLEAFKIIAGVQGDKMYQVANQQLEKLIQIVDELKKKKGGGLGKAAL